MGLFKKKRVSQKLSKPQKLTPIPEFPRYPSIPEYARYESQLREPEIPQYNYPEEVLPKLPPPPIFPAKSQWEIPKRSQFKTGIVPETEEFTFRMPKEEFESPLMHKEPSSDSIFVKLEDYKKSLENLRNIKERLRQAEKIIAEVVGLKAEEDKQLANWQQEITEIKSKLMEIDKDLFEYE